MTLDTPRSGHSAVADLDAGDLVMNVSAQNGLPQMTLSIDGPATGQTYPCGTEVANTSITFVGSDIVPTARTVNSDTSVAHDLTNGAFDVILRDPP